MKVFVINYMAGSLFEQECGDHGFDELGLDGAASPQVFALASEISLEAKVAEAKKQCEDDQREQTLDKDPFVWEEGPWVGGTGRTHRILRMKVVRPPDSVLKFQDTHVGSVVIQVMEYE